MKPQALRHARWVENVNGVNPSVPMRHWLVDRASLTQKLVARCGKFRVQRLRQEFDLCLADESKTLGLARRTQVQEREVLLRCDEQAVVFAHTIVPLHSTATQWPFFGNLGERSLGTTLFGDPLVQQGSLQFARLQTTHLLVRRAARALKIERFDRPLYARRCLYRRKNGVLLVTEVFLPALDTLPALEVKKQER